MDARWRLELLGRLRAVRDDQVVTRFRSQRTAVLVAYLALYRHRWHPREELMELFWPECDLEAARNGFRVALSSLRRQLELPGVPAGAVILADRASVRLNPATVNTDVAEFEAALQAAAQAGSSSERAQRLTEAVALYHGELLPGHVATWILHERERLAERFLQALEQLIAHRERASNLPGALELARRAVAADPLREKSHRELMRLLAATGEREAAQRQYQELERLLEQELGAAPEAETKALVAALALTPDGDPARLADSDLSSAARGGRLTPDAGGDSPSRVRVDPKPLSGVRRQASGVALPTGTVTLLMTDIEGSTALWERTGEPFAVALAEHHALLRETFRQHGGHELKEMGDAFLVVFPAAGNALACAIAGQRALSDHAWPDAVGRLNVRMALHTGDVQLQGSDYHGLVLHHTQRILIAGHGGQILCSEKTAALLRDDLPPEIRLRDLGIFRLRDLVQMAKGYFREKVGRTRMLCASTLAPSPTRNNTSSRACCALPTPPPIATPASSCSPARARKSPN